jgi:ABC-type antimicrobial peptide transport system permease subunit
VEFAVRLAGATAGAGKDIVRQIRDEVRLVDSNLAIADIRTATEQIDHSLSQERLMASLAAMFAGLALLLAAIGIYGVMAYTVARRTGEIGIRMALGAQAAQIASMALGEILMLVLGGLAMGIPAILAAGPIIDHFLAPAWLNHFAYGVKANDPVMIVAATSILVLVALAAGYSPTRRAVKIDPMAALRHE